MQSNKLGLTIPEQTNHSTAEQSTEAIEKFRSALQTLDTSEAARKMIEMLQQLNSTAINADTRLQLLELIRQSAQSNYLALKKHYLNRTQTLTATKLSLIDLSKSLQTELLNGYKIIITNANPEILPITIHHAFEHFANLLTIYYQLYAQPIENIWKEIYIIYQYAENLKITDKPINNEIVITPFRHLLFLTAIHPYQWRQYEQDLLYKYAQLWDEFIIIRKFKSKDLTATGGIFFIPTNKDNGPFAIIEEKSNVTDSGLVLDLSKLIIYLKDSGSNNKDNLTTEMEKHSLQKLIYYLINGPKRKLERFKITGQVSAAFGFLSTHYHINKRKYFNADNVGSDSTEDSIQELQLGTDTVLDDTAQHNDTILYKCNLINIHGEGAGILFKDIAFPPIQPGEIVTLTITAEESSDLDETHWNIGTIRWLKHDLQNTLIAGIEILAPFAMAAAVQIQKNGAAFGYFQRALLFKNQETNLFNLITPVLQFELGKIVSIYSYYHKEFVETELKQQLISNSNFKCFAVNIKFKHN